MTIIRMYVDGEPYNDWTTLTFPGGEPHAILPTPPTGDVYIDARVSDFAGLGQALCLVRAAGDTAAHVHLHLPYMPGARGDKDPGGALRLVAAMINEVEPSSMTIVDPHSGVAVDVIDGYSTDVVVIPGHLYVDAPTTPTVLIQPDAGAKERTAGLAVHLAMNRYVDGVVVASKHRDPATGKLSGFTCEPIPAGHNALVYDDICDGGGTFIGLAEATGLPRERLSLHVTHGIFSKGLDELFEHYGRITCTDSFPSPHLNDPRLNVIEIGPHRG